MEQYHILFIVVFLIIVFFLMYVNSENASGDSKCEKESQWCTDLYKKNNSNFKFDPKKNKWAPFCNGKKSSWADGCVPANCSGPRQCQLETVTTGSGFSVTTSAKCADGKFRDYKSPKKPEDVCKPFGGLFSSKKPAPPPKKPPPKKPSSPPPKKPSSPPPKRPSSPPKPAAKIAPKSTKMSPAPLKIAPVSSLPVMGTKSSVMGPQRSSSSPFMGLQSSGMSPQMSSSSPFMDTEMSSSSPFMGLQSSGMGPVSMGLQSSAMAPMFMGLQSSGATRSSGMGFQGITRASVGRTTQPPTPISQCPSTTIVIQQPEPLYDYEDKSSFWSTPIYRHDDYDYKYEEPKFIPIK